MSVAAEALHGITGPADRRGPGVCGSQCRMRRFDDGAAREIDRPPRRGQAAGLGQAAALRIADLTRDDLPLPFFAAEPAALIVSSIAVDNEIARTRPDRLEVRCRPYLRRRPGQKRAGEKPYYPQPISGVRAALSRPARRRRARRLSLGGRSASIPDDLI